MRYYLVVHQDDCYYPIVINQKPPKMIINIKCSRETNKKKRMNKIKQVGILYCILTPDIYLCKLR